ncbi:MAG: class I SAM-dependent methyltransferase [Wenzhouxiangellaceae bacterium]|nr:class I SAM-dependent methyltransferase [Wenzhouxiangellaceae bacterium]
MSVLQDTIKRPYRRGSTEETITHSTKVIEEKVTEEGSQNFGVDPVEVRDTNHYQQEYVESFVDKWDELIDWDARYESEGDFFIKLLKDRGAKRILDVATGTGFHSVRLIEEGFEVCSVDGSAAMLAKAFENGRKRGHILRTIQADWRWLNRDVHAAYDAVICLGNSFNHLFDERDRRKALAEFYAVLKHDGCLILDQRNYDAILDEGFSSKHKFYYCGRQVSAEPEYVDEGLARFRYTFPDDSVYYLNMCPIRRDYTRRLMQEVGFQKIATYADFEDEEGSGTADFYIHVAEKKYFGAEDIGEDDAPNTVEAGKS